MCPSPRWPVLNAYIDERFKLMKRSHWDNQFLIVKSATFTLAQCRFFGQVQIVAQSGCLNRRTVRAFETSRTGLLFSRKSGFGNILILARSGYPLAWILALTNASHFWLLPGQHTNVTRTTIRNWLILLVQLACPLARSGHSWPGPETHRAVKLTNSVNFWL